MSDDKAFEMKIASWLGDRQPDKERDELTDALDMLYASGPAAMRSSRARDLMRKRVSELQAVKVYFDVWNDSPIGPIFVGVDDQGVVAIKIDVSEAEFVSGLEKDHKPGVIRSQEKVAGVITQLQEYFEGKRSSFSLNLNLKQLTQFQRKVLLATLDIPHGQITTYGDIARHLGKARLARAVGQALARNPVPILIPCHRVLSADGSLHGYSGGKGTETKRMLLQLEGAFSS